MLRKLGWKFALTLAKLCPWDVDLDVQVVVPNVQTPVQNVLMVVHQGVLAMTVSGGCSSGGCAVCTIASVV